MADTAPSEPTVGQLLRRAKPDPNPAWMHRAPHAELLGERIKPPIGDMEIVRRLGGGSMGTVYEAIHAGASVALKVLNQLSPQQLYCLKNEFRTLAGISHPNIVSAYQLFGDDDAWYFTMELVAGMPLNHYWRSQPAAPEHIAHYTAERDQLLRELLQQLIEGVVAMHRVGLVHRDLKPSNVLVAPSGRLVIVDFGLVSDQHAGGVGQTVERAIAGTPAYMAPEQGQALPATAASDWYAVGVMLYELLSGRLPHQGSTSELLHAKREVIPEGPASIVPAVPADLDDLCQALMHPEPARRPSSDQMLALSRSWQLCDTRGEREPAAAIERQERFVGRRELLSQLDHAFRRAGADGPGVVLIAGDSGIGKTALLGQFVAGLQRIEHTFVLQGRCYEQETVPHKAFDGIIDQLTRVLLRLPPEQALQLAPRHTYALTRLFPVLLRVPCFREAALTAKPPADTAQLRRHGYEALRELFCRVADRRALVLAIDDLHWGDDDSLRLLVDVLAPPDAPRLLLVATYRPEAAGRIEPVLARPECPEPLRFHLGKLRESEACTLAASILEGAGEETNAVARSIAEETEGMPLYVVELARSYRERGSSGSASLAQLLQCSIERLRSDQREVFELIAAAGRPLSRALIAGASGLTDLHEPLALLRKNRLVRASADDTGEEFFETYHNRVRQACLALMDGARLRECRLKLAHALESGGSEEAEWLSELYYAIGKRAAAAHYALEAGHLANAALAFHRAAELFARALLYFEDSTSAAVRAEVLSLQARALAIAGRSAEAAHAFARAAQLSYRRDALRLESAANRQWMRSGHLEQALSGLQDVFRKLGIAWPRTHTEALARLFLNRARIRIAGLGFDLSERREVPELLLDQLDALHPAQTALGMFDAIRGAYFASVALPIALRAGNPRHLVTCLMSESVYTAMLGGLQTFERSQAVRETLDTVARGVSDPLARAIVKLSAALCAYWEGRWVVVSELANAAAEVFATEVLEGAWEVALARSIRSTVEVHTGQLRANRAELASARRDASARNDQYALLDIERSLAATSLMADDIEHAEHMLSELERRLARIPLSPMQVLMTSSCVALHLYRGEAELARARLDEGYRKSAQLGVLRFPLVRLIVLGMRADCLAACSRTSTRSKAKGLAELARNARAVPIAWAEPLGHSLRGQAEAMLGNRSAAMQAAQLAQSGYERQGMRVPAAVERLRHSEYSASGTAGSEALDELQSFGIKVPSRWSIIARSLY